MLGNDSKGYQRFCFVGGFHRWNKLRCPDEAGAFAFFHLNHVQHHQTPVIATVVTMTTTWL